MGLSFMAHNLFCVIVKLSASKTGKICRVWRAWSPTHSPRSRIITRVLWIGFSPLMRARSSETVYREIGVQENFEFFWSTFEHFVLLSPFSGLPHQDKPSVVSIETKCHLGELHWAEPFGGLRVTFNPRDVHTDYKLCFTARHPGVRIYQEHQQNLILLSGASENVSKQAVCVKSTAGERPVLYLETQEDQNMTQLNYTVLVNGRKRPRHERRKGKRIKAKCKQTPVPIFAKRAAD